MSSARVAKAQSFRRCSEAEAERFQHFLDAVAEFIREEMDRGALDDGNPERLVRELGESQVLTAIFYRHVEP